MTSESKKEKVFFWQETLTIKRIKNTLDEKDYFLIEGNGERYLVKNLVIGDTKFILEESFQNQ